MYIYIYMYIYRRSSSGVRSANWFTAAFHVEPGRLFSAAISETRSSKRALRRSYSSPPYDFPYWRRYSSNVTWDAAAGSARSTTRERIMAE